MLFVIPHYQDVMVLFVHGVVLLVKNPYFILVYVPVSYVTIICVNLQEVFYQSHKFISHKMHGINMRTC